MMVLATLVALEFLYIMYLETFRTTSAKTARVFKLSSADLNNTTVKTLFKNQGIYNGLLAVYVFASKVATLILMGYIVLVALYGSLTSNPKIILMQGGLAILTLLSTLL